MNKAKSERLHKVARAFAKRWHCRFRAMKGRDGGIIAAPNGRKFAFTYTTATQGNWSTPEGLRRQLAYQLEQVLD